MTVPGHGTIAPASSGTRSAGREGDYRAERRVEGFARGPHGQVDGLMLDDGTNVGTPPHALRADLSDVVGRTVEVSGRREQARVHHATIVINGDLVEQAPVGPHGPPVDERRLERSGEIRDVATGRWGEPNGVVLDDGTVVGPAPAFCPRGRPERLRRPELERRRLPAARRGPRGDRDAGRHRSGRRSGPRRRSQPPARAAVADGRRRASCRGPQQPLGCLMP